MVVFHEKGYKYFIAYKDGGNIISRTKIKSDGGKISIDFRPGWE